MQYSPQVETLPISAEDKRRVAMTLSCRDCDSIPKVPGAGAVIEENSSRYQLMHNGIRVLEDCYYGRWMTELIRLLHGHHEPQEERVFYELLKHIGPGATMVELGSFWSYYSLWFQLVVPGAKNFMVEPDPNNLAIGQKNFAINGMSGRFVNASVGRRSLPGGPFVCESDGATRQIPCIAVDDLVADQQIDGIELLLADTQGAELAALEGASSTISAGKLRFVILSTHHHSICHDPIIHQRCLQFLRGNGAHILAEHSVSESFSGDGLVAASFYESDRVIPAIEIGRNYPSNSLFRESEFDLAEAYEEIQSLKVDMANLNKELSESAAKNSSAEFELAKVNKEVQSLRAELAILNGKATRQVVEIQQLNKQVSEKEATIASILGSKSWRVTAILRKLSQALKP